MKFRINRLLVTVLAAALAFLGTTELKAADRPNIVVILCDDLGYGDLECYGHPHIKTPYLNKLAEEGIRFTDFYSASPVCSPSRVGLMTGRSPNRAGIYNWIPENQKMPMHMRASEVTIPQLLKKAGYATCLSGKWHCNSQFNSKKQPQPDDAGFDHWFATQNNASPSHQNPKNFIRNGERVGPIEGFSCEIVVDEAVTWLKGQQANDPKQPFFIHIAFHEPHEPVASPQDLVDSYKSVAKHEDQAQYFANVTNLDKAVGKFMDALKAMDIDDNTLVIFTSDNGPETPGRYRGSKRSFGTAKPLRGMKLWTTDAGFRVSGIMRWPEKVKPGQTVGQVVSSLDFLPTFCELANTKPPSDLELDGTSFLPALENKPIERKKPLLWIFYDALNEHRVAMRDGDWKVLAKMNLPELQMVSNSNAEEVKAATLSDFQIFKITEDIGESQDLSQSQPEKLAELKERLTKHYRELVDGSHVWDVNK